MIQKNSEVIGIGIESSCDETGIAVTADGSRILSNVVYSQIHEHSRFGGVVPELASRSHLEKINGVLEEALSQAGISAGDADYVAVTNRPGLTGSLMTGGMMAKSIALVHGTPVYPVNHLEAHLYATALEGIRPEYPFLGLLLSGGNSAVFLVEGLSVMKKIADTTDDAIGEAFDKAASLLKLPYPGGPHIEKEAVLYSEQLRSEPAGKNRTSVFPRLLKDVPEKELRFSFSGIKTAVMLASKRPELSAGRICYDFQNTVFELVERMLLRAVKLTGVQRVIASGGVLANGTLRQRLTDLAGRKKFQLHYPQSRILCTDNGAMTAALGYFYYKKGIQPDKDFAVSSGAEYL